MERDELNLLCLGEIIEDVVDVFTPTVRMTVTYGNAEFANAKLLYPSLVANAPKVEVPDGDYETFFTLVMTNPDFPNPSNPCLREHLHWIVTDIRGTKDAISGKEVVRYESPAPSIGIHRFVFLLFKQQAKKSVVAIPSERDNFRTRKFAEENKLGRPVAGCFFTSQRETAARRR